MARSKSKQKKQESSEPEVFEVERILAHKRDKKKGLQYHVKWVGYPDSSNTWEPVENVEADVLLEKYWKKKSPAEYVDRYEPGTHEYRKYLKYHPEVAPPSSGAGRKKRVAKEEEDDEAAAEEEAEKEPAVKKARRSSASASPAKKKQVKSSAPPAKRVKKEVAQAAADDADDEPMEADEDGEDAAAAAEEEEEEEEKKKETEEEDEEDLGEEVQWEDLPFINKANWEDEIEFVSTVDIDHEAEASKPSQSKSKKASAAANGATQDSRSKKQQRRDEGPPVVRFQVAWRGEKRTHSWVPNEVLKEHAAKPMLAFYELHLKFRSKPNDAEEEEEEEEEGPAGADNDDDDE